MKISLTAKRSDKIDHYVSYREFFLFEATKDARDIEFQRVHRLGKRSDKKGKPRVIIARFLSYTDREAVFSLRASLDKESEVGIGPDLPKDVVDMRKPLIPKMLEARKQGKHAAFSRAEPYKLFIDGRQFN